MKRADENSLNKRAREATEVDETTDGIDAFRNALCLLDENHREVIRLLYISRLSVAETARKLDRSERSVQNLCAHALIRLREHLGDFV